MSSAPGFLPRKTPAHGPGVLTGHLLAYGDLLTALAQAWMRSMGQRLAGAVLAICGLSTGLLLLTIGAVVAAWPTEYRWLVLLSVAGAYLLAGAIGVWLVVRRSAAPAPATILLKELGKDAELLSSALRGRRDES